MGWGDTVGAGSSRKLADGGDAAVEPIDWPVAPALGVHQLLTRHNLRPQDIDLWEINEAFAVVVLANCRILDISLDKVNINGGAISMGHPFGMSGARIANH